MFFTQEDYRKIEKWLLANSRKDTGFVGAATPLKGNETVVLVQDGKNVKTSVKDIVDQFFLLGVSDFLNITDKYGESYISLTQAIQLIPFRSRKIGQVITFIDEFGNWAIYQFQGKALNQWNNITLWIDLLAKLSGIPIIDSEDITTKENGAKQVSLYLADKQYNEADYSGLGRIYLRKSIYAVVDPSTDKVINVNLLTQSMLAKENTTYIIQYDYNLNKQTISIPEGSVLLFEGGSIDNGTINCNGTTIVDKFSGNATIVGTYSFQDAQADEEDITQNQSSVLKFKDRKYEPDKYSGLGRVILRKNIVEIDDPIYGKVTKNVLFQDRIAQANTIYEIRYDYSLNGNTVTIPEGCILDMRGGSITNGTINCVDTIIISTDASKLDVTLTGTYRFDSEKLVTLNTEDINISQSVDRKSHTISAMLADRDTTNGMGYVILRKDKSFASQLTQQNTIYVIRYDFTLTGNVTVPVNCILEFDGGSIIGNGVYTLDLENALIKGINCISYNVILKGNCKNTDICVEWFIGTDLQKIQAAMNYVNETVVRHSTTGSSAYKISYKKVIFANYKHYVIDNSINLPFYTSIEGNNALIEITTNDSIMVANTSAFFCFIKDLTFLGNDVTALYLNTGNLDSASLVLSNLIFETNTYTKGKYAIYIYNQSSQCLIEKCICRNSSNFLTVNCDSLIIRDCWINKWAANTTPDTCSIELRSGCRYTRIENCQLVPNLNSDYDYRWIDLKGGRLSVSNCIFGGEYAGIPIIWLYNSGSNISIRDSQVACGATFSKAGIIVLMNNIIPGNIILENVVWEYSRVITPYGYIKQDGGVVTYGDTEIQQAFDSLVDNIITNQSYFSIKGIPNTTYQPNYCLNPYFTSESNSVIINNPEISNNQKSFNLCKFLSNNTNGADRLIDLDIIIILSGLDKLGYPYIAEYRYNIMWCLNYALDASNLDFKNKKFAERVQGNAEPYITLTVSLANSIVSLNCSTTDNVSITKIKYNFIENIARDIPNNDTSLFIYPQKCIETIR